MEDKNQTTATEPVKSEAQAPAGQQTNNVNNEAQDKEGLEQEASIKNSK